MITPDQLAAITGIVDDHHSVLIQALCGDAVLPADVIARVAALGLPGVVVVPPVPDAVTLGVILAAQPDPGTEPSAEQMTARLAAHREVPLSRAEARAVEFAGARAGRYCKGLGNRVSETVEGEIIRASAEEVEAVRGVVREETREAIWGRESVARLKQRLGRATGDWVRDLQRIATTEINNAHCDGRAAELLDKHGADVMVAKRPHADACDACKDLYLDHATGRPRVFKLSELVGVSNAHDPKRPGKARRRSDWIATAEGIHPWCQCVGPIRVPRGWGFDANWDLVPESMVDEA